MSLLSYLPLLLPLVPLTMPSDLYIPLRNKPTRPTSLWNPLSQLQYNFHRAYFYYLVTGPGYVLEPAECRFLDAFILILLSAVYYLLSLMLPVVSVLVWAAVRNSVLGGILEDHAVGYGLPGTMVLKGLSLWEGNVRQGVLGFWSLGQAGLGAAGNATAMASPLAV